MTHDPIQADEFAVLRNALHADPDSEGTDPGAIGYWAHELAPKLMAAHDALASRIATLTAERDAARCYQQAFTRLIEACAHMIDTKMPRDKEAILNRAIDLGLENNRLTAENAALAVERDATRAEAADWHRVARRLSAAIAEAEKGAGQ